MQYKLGVVEKQKEEEMKFEQVSQSMYEFFIQNHVVRAVMPYAVLLMFLFEALSVLGHFVTLGSAVGVISYIGFLFMAILVLSLCNFRMAAIGFGIYALQYLHYVLKYLLRDYRMEWGSAIYFVVYVYFAYQCYKKSLVINE